MVVPFPSEPYASLDNSYRNMLLDGPDVLSLEGNVEWVTAESKCCPFFDFHIDVER